MTQTDAAIYLIVGIALLFGLFLLLRELNCWYWKINRRIELQEKAIDLLTGILAEMKAENSKQSASDSKE